MGKATPSLPSCPTIVHLPSTFDNAHLNTSRTNTSSTNTCTYIRGPVKDFAGLEKASRQVCGNGASGKRWFSNMHARWAGPQRVEPLNAREQIHKKALTQDCVNSLLQPIQIAAFGARVDGGFHLQHEACNGMDVNSKYCPTQKREKPVGANERAHIKARVGCRCQEQGAVLKSNCPCWLPAHDGLLTSKTTGAAMMKIDCVSLSQRNTICFQI